MSRENPGLAMLAAVWLIGCAGGSTNHAGVREDVGTVSRVDRSEDEAAIRRIEQAYDRAWNAGDAAGLVASMAPDVVVVNPRGQVAIGRDAFEGVMREVLSGPFAGTRHASTIARIHFPAADVAVVDGQATVTAPGAAPATSVQFTDVFVRSAGGWLLAEVRAYVWLPE